jgi:hypothetical protein
MDMDHASHSWPCLEIMAYVSFLSYNGGGGGGKALLYNGCVSFLPACDALVDQDLRYDFGI